MTDNKKLLLLSTCRLDENTGRADKFRTRSRLLEEMGWEVVLEYVPEIRVGSIPSAVRSAIRTAKRSDVDVVVAPSEPWHIQVIGLAVQQATNRPLVAEFRDPLVTNPNAASTGPTHWFRKVLEWLVVHRADRVVWWDGIQLEPNYFDRHYDVPPHRIRKLPLMGFDSEQFDGVPPAENDEFTIVYAGSFYDGWIEPYQFLDGMREYLDENPERSLSLEVYGDWNQEYQEYVEERGLEHSVTANGFVDHDSLVPQLKGADASLYIGGTDERNRLNIPSKIWDYVGARTPIIGVVDPSFRAAEFIQSNDLGIVVDPRDKSAIAAGIGELRNRSELSSAQPSKFSRRKPLRVLVDVLEEVV